MSTLEPEIHSGVNGDLNGGIARAVVRCYREHVGRGPDKTKAFYKDNVVVVVMEHAMTLQERTLALGHGGVVVELRRAVDEAMRDSLAASVRQLTGAEVLAVTATLDPAADVASCVFLLDRPVVSR